MANLSELKGYILSQFGMTGLRPSDYANTGKDLVAQPRTYESQQWGENLNNLSTMPDGMVGHLGKPVFCDMQLELPDGSFLYLDVVLVDVSMQKTIVKTAVNGMAGTVKEYINDGDYSASIRGVLYSNTPGDYPRSQVDALVAVCKRKEAIPVVSEYLKQFGIFFVVIEGYNFPQRNGWQNTQLFELSAVSDTENDVLIERI